MAMRELPRVICLLGATGSGKTSLAVEIVQHFPKQFEIISVDSVMVYRGMNIGAAKPDAKTLSIAPHRLIDIIDPADIYSAGRFRLDAMREIEETVNGGKIPLLVGGTMMYFRCLQQGLHDLPPANATLRAELYRRAQSEGWEMLHAELASYDEASAKRIHQHDSQRISRALEVYLLTGQSLTDWQASSMRSALHDYHVLNLIVSPYDRSELHERILKRFDDMLARGLVDEVKALYERGDLSKQLPSIRSVGYREVWDYLDQSLSFESMRERAIIATRQLAKRQLTWLRSETFADAAWFESGKSTQIIAHLREILG